MYKTLQVEIVGVAPLLMHNGQTADPLNKFAKALKEVSGKRKKTEADYVEMAKIEYRAGLYMDENGPVIPAVMIEAAILGGAKKSKDGMLVKAGVVVEKNAPLRYTGPRGAKELWEDETFRMVSPVRIGTNKVMRTRPFFKEWSARIEVMYLDDVLNRQSLMTAIRNAGMYCGFGDWRPRYGRFGIADETQIATAAPAARKAPVKAAAKRRK